MECEDPAFREMYLRMGGNINRNLEWYIDL